MIGINVVADTKEMARDLQRIQKAIPKIASKAINELAKWGRNETIDQTAKDLRLPKARVSRTTKDGASVPRFKLTRAKVSYPVATLTVAGDGIQATDVALAAVNPWNVPGRKHKKRGGGVKARGGRFYKGAFKAMKGGKLRVWIPRSADSGINPGKKKLGLIRIGTRDAMLRVFDKKVNSGQGVAVYRREFEKQANIELAKAGIR